MATARAEHVPALSRLRALWLVWGYAVLAAFLAVCATISIYAGNNEHPPPAIAGIYNSKSDCLGSSFQVRQSGQFVNLSTGPDGKYRLQHDRIHGDVTCADGGAVALDLSVAGDAANRQLVGTVGGQQVTAKFSEALPEPGAGVKPKKRSNEETFGRLMLAIAAVILAARLFGVALGAIGQPRVMGEV